MSISANQLCPEPVDRIDDGPLLTSVIDDYGGVIVELKDPMDSTSFQFSLRRSLANWRKQNYGVFDKCNGRKSSNRKRQTKSNSRSMKFWKLCREGILRLQSCKLLGSIFDTSSLASIWLGSGVNSYILLEDNSRHSRCALETCAAEL